MGHAFHCLSSVVDNKPCLRSFGSESSPNCCCFVGHTWVTSPRNGLGWRCLFCWGSDYALYRFVLTLHFLPVAVFYALATRFSNTARLFYCSAKTKPKPIESCAIVLKERTWPPLQPDFHCCLQCLPIPWVELMRVERSRHKYMLDRQICAIFLTSYSSRQ